MKIVQTDKAPFAIGAYSQAIIANGFVFCSGQIGIDPKTRGLVKGVENQTKQVINNLSAVLDTAGASLQTIVKTTIFITDLGNYAKVNEIYASFFTKNKPARATVEVSKLPKNALVEIEAIASLK